MDKFVNPFSDFGFKKIFGSEVSLSVERDLSAALETSFEDGEAKGRAEGKAEAERTVAIKMKKQGVAPEVIAQCCDLSIVEIQAL